MKYIWYSPQKSKYPLYIVLSCITIPDVDGGGDVGDSVGVSKMLKFPVKVIYVYDKALISELPCTRQFLLFD